MFIYCMARELISIIMTHRLRYIYRSSIIIIKYKKDKELKMESWRTAVTQSTTVKVNYERIDNYHLFTSKQITGLTIGSSNCERAFNDVSKAIEVLMKENHQINCKASPMMTFGEFTEATDAAPCETRSFELKMAA